MNTIRPSVLVLLIISSVATAQSKLDTAIKLEKEGQYEQAKVLFQRITKEAPNDAKSFYYLGLMSMLYDYDGAINYLKTAIKLDYADADYHVALGNSFGIKAARASIFSKLGAASDCLKQYKIAAQLDPKNLSARVGLINYYAQAPGIIGGSIEKAYAQADTIKMSDPYTGNLAEAMIRGYRKERSKEEQCYLEALSIDPKRLKAYEGLWRFYSRQKDYSKAKEIVARMLNTAADKSGAEYSAGLYYEELSDLDKAVLMFSAALSRDSADARVYYQLGKAALFSGKDLEKGLEFFRKCLQSEPLEDAPTWPYAHWRMGMIYEKLGKRDSARSEYEVALALDSHLEKVKKSLEKLR